MSTQDEERLRLMSQAEIDAMDDDDYDAAADNAAADAEIGRGEIGDDEPEVDVDDDGEPEAKPEQEPEAKPETPEPEAEPEAEAEAETDPAGGDEPAAAPAPKQSGYNVEAPSDLDEKLKANRKASAELRRKFNDGDVDADDYDAKVAELEDERDNLRDLKTRSTIAAEMREQTQANEWVSTINTFVADAAKSPELGVVDYAKDADKQADLDSFVKAIANKPGNENKPMRWYLEEAHKRVVALHGIATSAKKAPAPTRKADPSKVVTGLADVAGGDGDADPVGNEFAELDKLKGPDYERAIADLKQRSPDKYHRYMRLA